MDKIYKILGSSVAFLFPMLVLAQVSDIKGLLSAFRNVLNQIIPILIGLAGVIFLWGVIQFIMGAADEEKRSKGRNLIIYGLIGLAVMLSFWGLVNILLGTFGPTNVTTPSAPIVPPAR
ncbi:hypothetical protein IIA95_01200 [Patescibacteria group bacterium]|nr:hypothetical protein [Patescibacteria group bacterium]